MARRKAGVLVNTSLRWNSIWSHSHELTKQLAKDFRVLYYEPPRLDNPRSPVLHEQNDFERPKGVEFLSVREPLSTLGVRYLLRYQWHSLGTFWKRRKEFDVFLTYNVYEYPNLLLARLLRKKVLFILADEYDELTTVPAAKPYLRFALTRFLRRADLVVATAKTLADRAERYNANVRYLPNAVNLEDREHAAKRSVKSKRFTVGFLGSIENWVDHTPIVEAAKRLPSVQFEIIGDGGTRKRFEKEAQGLKNIRFHGYVAHSEVYPMIGRWHLAVIPFRINKITNGVSPVKLFEYWLMELPVATTRTAELSQFDNILFFTDGEELSEIIADSKKHPGKARRLGKEGKRLVEERFNWQRYRKVYKDLIEGLA